MIIINFNVQLIFMAVIIMIHISVLANVHYLEWCTLATSVCSECVETEV